MKFKNMSSRLFFALLFLRMAKYLALLVVILILGKSGQLFPAGFPISAPVILALVIAAVIIRLIGKHLYKNIVLQGMRSVQLGENSSNDSEDIIGKINRKL